MISNSDMRYLALASSEAIKSNQQHQHGCVAVSSGKICGKGYNSGRTQSCDGFINNTCSCHAEIAALRNMWHNSCASSKGEKVNKRCKLQGF